MITPDASEIRPTYNEAGLLDKVEARVRGAATWTPFVDNIDYDAKGQREKIVYSGGATTTEYEYDGKTFRLKHLVTTRALGKKRIQDLSYTYDPVGNITEIVDAAQQEVFFDGDEVQPKMAYVYDALYRLTSATGREHASTGAYVQPDENDAPIKSLPHANDVQALRNYTESYEYDAVGNILRMIHDSGAPETSWTRRYDVSATSNRLLRTSAAGDGPGQFSAQYGYDVHGNMTSMPHLAAVGWNYRDEMVSADKGGGGIVYFTYDAGGERVRKVYEHNGLIEERIYLGGWEIYRKRLVSAPDEIVLERETLHMMDGVRRIAMVETKTIDEDAGGAFQVSTVTRFQMGNHLGSAALEVDASGLVISYEEYHPYGTTAYWSASGAVEVSRKRYRYTGKEKDEETGLYYHGARYYAPWLGRWTAADPAGLVDGLGLYTYCGDGPVIHVDPNGKEKSAAEVAYGQYQWHSQMAARLQASGANPSFVATFQAQAENFKRLALQGPGGKSGVPVAAAFGGSAAIRAMKPTTVRADAPKSIRPLMALSNEATPQVQAATVRGMQAGAVAAMVLPGAAAAGAVAPHVGAGVARLANTASIQAMVRAPRLTGAIFELIGAEANAAVGAGGVLAASLGAGTTAAARAASASRSPLRNLVTSLAWLFVGGGGPGGGDASVGRAPISRFTGYHGATGDKILGIIEKGGLIPKDGVAWVGQSVSQVFIHGVDKARGASLAVELDIVLKEGAKREAFSTTGVSHAIRLSSDSLIPATVKRLWVRPPTSDGKAGVPTMIEGVEAIKKFLLDKK